MTQITRLHILAPSTLFQVQSLAEQMGRSEAGVIRIAVGRMYDKENDMTIAMKVIEPNWKQSREMMISCLRGLARGDDDEWSASNWALWQIKNLEKRLNDLGAYADDLEEKLSK